MKIEVKKALYKESHEFKDYKKKQELLVKDLAGSIFLWLFIISAGTFIFFISPRGGENLTTLMAKILVTTSFFLFCYYSFYTGSLIVMLRNNKKDFKKKMERKFLVVM